MFRFFIVTITLLILAIDLPASAQRPSDVAVDPIDWVGKKPEYRHPEAQYALLSHPYLTALSSTPLTLRAGGIKGPGKVGQKTYSNAEFSYYNMGYETTEVKSLFFDGTQYVTFEIIAGANKRDIYLLPAYDKKDDTSTYKCVENKEHHLNTYYTEKWPVRHIGRSMYKRAYERRFYKNIERDSKSVPECSGIQLSDIAANIISPHAMNSKNENLNERLLRDPIDVCYHLSPEECAGITIGLISAAGQTENTKIRSLFLQYISNALVKSSVKNTSSNEANEDDEVATLFTALSLLEALRVNDELAIETLGMHNETVEACALKPDSWTTGLIYNACAHAAIIWTFSALSSYSKNDAIFVRAGMLMAGCDLLNAQGQKYCN